MSEESLVPSGLRRTDRSRLTSEAAETPIENLDLSVRVFNSLKRTGITTVGEVMELLDKGDETVMAIRNFGDKSLDELREKMREKGYLQDEETKRSKQICDTELRYNTVSAEVAMASACACGGL